MDSRAEFGRWRALAIRGRCGGARGFAISNIYLRMNINRLSTGGTKSRQHQQALLVH
jgi:hypothetical protein